MPTRNYAGLVPVSKPGSVIYERRWRDGAAEAAQAEREAERRPLRSIAINARAFLSLASIISAAITGCG